MAAGIIRPGLSALLVAGAGASLFLASLGPLRQAGEQAPDAWAPELAVVLPPGLATAMTGGDPYLAANFQVIRGMVVAHRLEGNDQQMLFTRLIRNASRLNPAHEDGYYLAQAILPWNGFVRTNQAIQADAAAARPWDWLPLFFQAFNRYYFLREPGPASTILKRAAQRAAPSNRESLLANAARWRAVGRNPEEALRMIQAMAEGTPEGPLRRQLRGRKVQLTGLLELRRAAKTFRQQEGRQPQRLEELVGYGDLQSIPKDPFGEGYLINDEGQVVITPPKPLRHKPKLPEGIE